MMSSPPPPPEHSRRIAARRALRQDAIVTHGPTRTPVQTWDIGREGISVIAARPIAPGTRCQIEFDLPLGGTLHPIAASAKVVYSSYSAAGEFKIGAVFTELSEDVAATLSRFAAGA